MHPAQVEDTLFQVPVRQLKQSEYFLSMVKEMSTKLEPEARESKSPIPLSGVSALEMESFLTALGASFLFGDPNLSFAQWAAALRLATIWSFDDVRERIIAQMDPILHTANPFDQIDASLNCRVEKWLYLAYEALCSRKNGLTEDEAERLGIRRATAIWRIRESLRPGRGWSQGGSVNQKALALVKNEGALKYS
ncbi:hypothetical protein FS837_005073 [Tulasnella sp. UAMH 9824]|nr:hypothetical protein FS837_005073 [Tulasnella sp. UAMH 9824]